VGNTPNFTQSDWAYNIGLAKEAHIDAFALNMAWGDPTNDAQLPNAFNAAIAAGGFQQFFSFDYAGNGPWEANIVIALLSQYVTSPAYYFYGDQPLVSTFEGPNSASDWPGIKEATGSYFIPDWSSQGAKTVLAIGSGIVDGLFSKSSGAQNYISFSDCS
jgi:hypothetical protein